MLTTLENTSLALWVGESLWAYPSLLACHIVGLAIVAGIFSMRDLKLLGFFPTLDIAAFRHLLRLALLGFAINAISGFLLFSSQATYLATSIPFLSKLVCIAVGMSTALVLQSRLSFQLVSGLESASVDRATQLLAALSLSVWVGAIIAGRLIAYIF
ncbi:MAG TPA: hypothetical protein DCX09_10490 [Gammaproteobacteria bacterium]|nr:hypothetical protein [Gammaproteobacteria bacterium]HAU25091.1 hypothetical protein [Gammaproteobacteria bacterium]|tara:strand:+ start:140 stop:610 length:471 start_codon:yes stop_codon:yes gene_type:complete